MKLLGIRFCTIAKEGEALATFLRDGVGLQSTLDFGEGKEFNGAVFPAGESWVEVWSEGPGMPAGIMLQLVVDDADLWAESMRERGLKPVGPMDAHGERIYSLTGPTGLPITFQSKSHVA